MWWFFTLIMISSYMANLAGDDDDDDDDGDNDDNDHDHDHDDLLQLS